jgi:transcriptional regulator with XRE-family HTH domain
MYACTALELREVAIDDCRMHTGERIKRAREEAQLGQRDVAEALGVSVSTVSNWERGKTVPRSRQGALEKLLGLTLTEVEVVSHVRPTLKDASDMELAMEFFRRIQDAKLSAGPAKDDPDESEGPTMAQYDATIAPEDRHPPRQQPRRRQGNG